MKNILFVTEVELSPIQGGTEHITHTLSQSFRALGNSCSLAYLEPISADLKSTEFDSKLQLNLNEKWITKLAGFLQEHKINIVIVNLVKKKSKQAIMPKLYEEAHKQEAKVIACYHAMPGEDLKPSDFNHIFYQIRHRYCIAQAFKDLYLHLSPYWLNRRLVRAKYRLMPEYSDAFILLSSKFYQQYIKLAGQFNYSHFYSIGNALSFSDNISEEKIADKQHVVLVVARQQERSKRLSKVLRIWKIIEKNPELKDWKLQIVGGGPDAPYYRYLHQKLGLQRCELLGRQPEIIPYYEKASIFMMTSSFEGFGITLTEAQQYACVPIVQNTYASLTDIVHDGVNGVIVDVDNDNEYAEQLTHLMLNTEQREKMARAGLHSCQRFSQERITQQWLDLFDKLLAK